MIHTHAFTILNCIFETARNVSELQVPINVPQKTLINIINKFLVEQFDALTSKLSFMTPDIANFCHDNLVTKFNTDKHSYQINEDDVLLENDILSCSDLLYPSSRPKSLPDKTDEYLLNEKLVWYKIKGDNKQLGYVVIDPEKLGFIIIQTSKNLTLQLRNLIADQIKFVLYFCEKLTDFLLLSEFSVNESVQNIMGKIMATT
ncbi:MAG: hypothetical protein KDH96_06300 [Candidatus Riesia sp.]|nr:hypothetical protein [Candidatus Riesia sp.]